MKKILIYNTGGGLGDSIQIINLILSLKKKFYNQKIFNVNNIKEGLEGEIIFFNDIKYEKDINDIMNKTNHDKPWGRSDTYTKKKTIDVFILKYLETHKNEDIDIIKNELYELLENKKISKKNIEFDTDNNIFYKMFIKKLIDKMDD